MLTPELLRQVRRLHLRARRSVEDPLGGAYRSVFKGTGIAFEEVREYQPGDDVRAIDWNVTARMGHPFIKRYVEERERTLVFLVDASSSMSFGSRTPDRRQTMAECVALLSLSALRHQDKLSLLLATDRVELFLPPRKGPRHALKLIRAASSPSPPGKGTRLQVGLDFLQQVLKRRALVFVFSDFLDEGYGPSLRRIAARHDVIAVTIADLREEELPDVGLLRVRDLETGSERVVDTSAPQVRAELARRAGAHRAAIQNLPRLAPVEVLLLTTGGNHLDALIRFFQRRARRQPHH